METEAFKAMALERLTEALKLPMGHTTTDWIRRVATARPSPMIVDVWKTNSAILELALRRRARVSQ